MDNDRYLDTLSDLTGKTAVVTGYGGIGYAVAYALAVKGSRVIIGGRTTQKGEDAISKIKADYADADVTFLKIDLTDLDSIRDFADNVGEMTDRVDMLMDIAGVMEPDKPTMTKYGTEEQFGANYLGHFVLTSHLMPLLKNSPDPRVITVSSIANKPGKFDLADATMANGYHPSRMYALSKLCCLMFALELQARCDRSGIKLKAICVHPGLARTQLFNRRKKGIMSLLNVIFLICPFLQQSPAAAARSPLVAATSQKAHGGDFYGPWFLAILGGPHRAILPKRAKDERLRCELWDYSERLSGADFKI